MDLPFESGCGIKQPRWQVSCQDKVGTTVAAHVNESLEETKQGRITAAEEDELFEIVTASGNVVPLNGLPFLVDEGDE